MERVNNIQLLFVDYWIYSYIDGVNCTKSTCNNILSAGFLSSHELYRNVLNAATKDQIND